MSLLTTVSPENAQGTVAEVYNEINAVWKMVPSPIQLFSVSPELLKNQWEKYKYFDSQEIPSAKLNTMIRLLVSEETKCEYCIGFNSGMLMQMFDMSVEEVQQLKADPGTADLDEKEKMLLLFVLKAVDHAHDVSKQDVQNLRDTGLTDKQIFEAVNSGATMRAGNILFDAFKVEIDY
ncbi:MAG: hypothetical protein QM479_06380 [Pseudomonadota bacterium]